MSTRKSLIVIIVLMLVLTACTRETPTSPPPVDTAAPTALVVEVTPTDAAPTDAPPTDPAPLEPTPTKPVDPKDEPLPADEQRIEFESEDGVSLVGSYFPAAVNPAPAVILMHMAGSERGTWEDLMMTAWLQNRPSSGGAFFISAQGAMLWPPMPPEMSFAVFTFDFREHGESGGTSESGSDYLVDAKAAIRVVQGLEGVDPERIAMIGASIGADAAVDACVSGCLGALSLSPGSYLDVPYAEVVTEMGLDGKPAWCLAAEDDGYSANTCKTASGDSYRSIIFGQGGHGEALLVSGMEPDIGGVIFDFLALTFSNIP